jgi:WD40 repeat protein
MHALTDTQMRIIDGAMDKGSELTCRSHVKVITCLQWSADGTYLVTSSYDKMVVIHSVTTNRSVHTIVSCNESTLTHIHMHDVARLSALRSA